MKNLKNKYGACLLMLGLILCAMFVTTDAFSSEFTALLTGDLSVSDFVFNVASLPDMSTLSWVSGGGVLHYAIIAPFTHKDIDGNVINVKKSGKLINAKLWFITEDQVDPDIDFPKRAEGTRDIPNIPLAAGQYWHYIKTVMLSKPEAGLGGDIGDVGATLTNEVSAVMGGVMDDVLDLLEQKIGTGFYLVADVEGYDDRLLYGTGFSPMVLQAPEGGFKSDASSIALKWANESGYYHSNYTGNTPTQAATSVDASAVALALTSAPVYAFDNATAGAGLADVTGLTDSDISRVITFIGNGSGSIIQSTAGDFMLIGAEAWTANAGAQISFKVFKQGSDSYKLIEVSGSRS